jgi:glyoxylase I family protein
MPQRASQGNEVTGTSEHAVGGESNKGLPGLTGLDHVGITVPDIEEATRFLVDVIGCEYLYTLGPLQDADGSWMADHLNVHPRAVARTIRFFRCAGHPVIEVFEYCAPDQNAAPPRNSDIGGHHLALYVKDLDAAVQHLRDHGVHVLGSPTTSRGPHTGQRWVYFLAPWGAQFELVSYPNGRAWYLENDARSQPASPTSTTAIGQDPDGIAEPAMTSAPSPAASSSAAQPGTTTPVGSMQAGKSEIAPIVIEADSVVKHFGGDTVKGVSVSVR